MKILARIPMANRGISPYRWYEDGYVVCPVNTQNNFRDLEEAVWSLDKLGMVDIEEVQMPLELPTRFFRCKLPDFLSLNDDRDGGYFFVDGKGIERLRVFVGSVFMDTFVITRYQPKPMLEVENKQPRLVPCVLDWQLSHEKEGDQYVWKGMPCKERGSRFKDSREMAIEWLDKNHPLWRDPMAYWGAVA